MRKRRCLLGLKFRQNVASQNFAQLNPLLIKREDVPNDSLHKHLMFVKSC
jgi:hypothetical protein